MQTWFVAEGKLNHADSSGAIRSIESAFIRESIERAERSQQLDSWKTAPRDEGESGLVPSSVLWGKRGGGTPSSPPRFQYAVRADNASLLYIVTHGGSTALFRYHPEEQRELRLFHGARMQCLGLAWDATTGNAVLSIGRPDGTASIEIVDADGNRRGPVTGGDSIDAAPSVSPREPGVVLFQSAGVARHAQGGHVAAIGPAALMRLDTRSAKLDTVLEDRRYDFLAPREDRAGNLWFIRRPYEKSLTESATTLGKDVVFSPWRLLKAIFGYLNVFTTIYGREPLRTGGGPQVPGLEQDLGALWLHGRMVQLRQVRYDAERGGGLVPNSWELVCLNRLGKTYVAARHVVSFDIAPDDSIVYSNGFDVFRLVDGDWKRLARSSLVETVCAGSA